MLITDILHKHDSDEKTSMRTDTPKTIYLKDYTPYPFTIQSLDLNFDIHDGHTIVTAKSRFERTNTDAKEVFLNGEDLELLHV